MTYVDKYKLTNITKIVRIQSSLRLLALNDESDLALWQGIEQNLWTVYLSIHPSIHPSIHLSIYFEREL